MNQTLTAGLGLKPQHFEAARDCRAAGLWFEVHPENYLVDGGPRLAWLSEIRSHHGIGLHGVALSLAADAPPDVAHLRRLRALADFIEPALVSEHLAWSTWRGAYYPDLLPFPRTSDALRRICANVSAAQDALGRRIAIENPSHYLRIEHEWDEVEFLGEIARRTGCGLLLDVNNVFVSATNIGIDPEAYIKAFPAKPLMEVHLAGHSMDPNLGAGLLIDSHDAPVSDAVWNLYEGLIERVGPRPTLVERDDQLPDFGTLLDERARAEATLSGLARAA